MKNKTLKIITLALMISIFGSTGAMASEKKMKKNYAGKGAKIGAITGSIAGFGSGLIFSSAIRQKDEDTAFSVYFENGIGTPLVFTMGGAALGAGIGAVIGSTIKRKDNQITITPIIMPGKENTTYGANLRVNF